MQLDSALVEEESTLSAALLESDQTMQGDRMKKDGQSTRKVVKDKKAVWVKK